MVDGREEPQFKVGLSDKIRAQRRATADMVSVRGARPAWKVSIRRVIAFALDCALLAAAGFAALKLAGSHIAPIGENGWWIGVAVAALYFGIMDSSLCRGKTLGKKIAGIEVQCVNGGYINPFDALLRFCVLAFIFSAYKFWLIEHQISRSIIPLVVAADLTALSVVILGLFHPQRRSLQDVLLNSIVVRSGAEYALPKVSMRRPLFILLILSALTGGGHAALMLHMEDSSQATNAGPKSGSIAKPGGAPAIRYRSTEGQSRRKAKAAQAPAGKQATPPEKTK